VIEAPLYLLYPSIDAVEGLCVLVAPALRLAACAGGCDRMAVWGLLGFGGGRMGGDIMAGVCHWHDLCYSKTRCVEK